MKVTETSEHIFTIRNFGNAETGADTHEELRHTFVPHSKPEGKSLPNMAKLINQRDRHYLEPVFDESEYQEEKFKKHQKEIESAGDKTKEVVYEPALDLGTASLQRIVSQMKGLKFETKEHRFNKDAAKLAGLKDYTDYISAPHKMRTWKAVHSLHKPKPADYKTGFVPAGYGNPYACETSAKITEQMEAVAA